MLVLDLINVHYGEKVSFNSPLEMLMRPRRYGGYLLNMFQFSIGDADGQLARVVGLYGLLGFNSPLEMHLMAAARVWLETCLEFQFSIGDAGFLGP